MLWVSVEYEWSDGYIFRDIRDPYLPNILVAHSANLLDVGRALRNTIEGVAEQLQLILLVLRRLDLDTWLHDDSADDLLTDEVSA